MKIALDYLVQFCINRRNSKSKEVHNMAFYLHSKIDDSESMHAFLEGEEIKKSKGHPIYLEVDYALNICRQKEKELVEEYNRKRLLASRYQNETNPNAITQSKSAQETQQEIERLREKIND